MAVELRHIRYFLAVAEEGNFTRAASRLGISQPPLSQQIGDLEAEIGARLFRRVPKGAELTEAGHAFLQAVRTIPDQTDHATRMAQRAARGEMGLLRVGYTATAMLTPLVPGAIRAFRTAFPSVDLILTEANSAELVRSVLDGGTDLAFLRPDAADLKRLSVHAFDDEPMIAALPAGHPATGVDDVPVRLIDLRNDPFVLTPRSVGPSLHDAVFRACQDAGFEPLIGQLAPQILSVLSLVAAGQGVSIVPQSTRQLAIAGIVYREIADARPMARLALVHQRGDHRVLVRNFVARSREGSELPDS